MKGLNSLWYSMNIPYHYVSVNCVRIGSDNGLSPVRNQAITWTNDDLSIGPLAANFSEICMEIQNFSFTKMHFKMSSAKWGPFSTGRDELNPIEISRCNYDIPEYKSIFYSKTFLCENVYHWFIFCNNNSNTINRDNKEWCNIIDSCMS